MADNFRFRIRGLKLKNIREIEDIEIKFEPNDQSTVDSKRLRKDDNVGNAALDVCG